MRDMCLFFGKSGQFIPTRRTERRASARQNGTNKTSTQSVPAKTARRSPVVHAGNGALERLYYITISCGCQERRFHILCFWRSRQKSASVFGGLIHPAPKTAKRERHTPLPFLLGGPQTDVRTPQNTAREKSPRPRSRQVPHTAYAGTTAVPFRPFRSCTRKALQNASWAW